MSARDPDLRSIILPPAATLREALDSLERAGLGAVAICDDRRRLLGLLTDGDIRGALLRSVPLTAACSTVARPQPIVVRAPVGGGEALRLMNKHDINHLPVVDAEGRLLELLRRHDLVHEDDPGLRLQRRVELATIAPDRPVGEVLARLDLAGTGALLVRGPDARLQGMITDGDLRRAVLRGVAMSRPCLEIASRDPVAVGPGVEAAAALHVMNERDINHLPVVDEDGRVVDLLLRKDLVSDRKANLAAVIMAGGLGQRLLPLTEGRPKPMLPVGDQPLLERTIRRLAAAGITSVHLTTHHLADQIAEHFGDGAAYGVDLRYAREDQPLGTAGGLKRLPASGEPLLVLNGDILTGVSYGEMLDFHRRHRADATVGVRKYEVEVPFGVVDCEDVRIRRLREKPTETLFINAGVYLLEPAAIDLIPDGVRFDMTDLIQALLDAGRPVVSYPILEYWIDIGRPEDYARAQDDHRNGRI